MCGIYQDLVLEIESEECTGVSVVRALAWLVYRDQCTRDIVDGRVMRMGKRR